MSNEQSEFWSKVAPKYDEVVDLQIGSKTRSMVRERLTREAHLGKVVEIGCGTGFYTQVLAAKADSLVATDLSSRMLTVAKERFKAANVTFQVEDCHETSLPDEAFDTVFIGLVIHFTRPEKTLVEMRRILKPGGTLIIANLDLHALKGLDRARRLIRVLYHGFIGYRTKPPKGFGKGLISEKKLRDLLGKSGFEVIGAETIRDPSRSSNIPVEYIKAVKFCRERAR